MRAVLFDIDGVLLDSQVANYRFYQDLIRKTEFQNRLHHFVD